ncbi:mitochondrial hypoxia responsive domain-containing protein [Melanomma pulvis-pyrius CBS 109.77]|uniref:Mitochondrial hypoxia responsive domain-containing protein n=1 Tax=Melanomma pulvis-pyrius CBS 109.77 TaxID=1314802 RepID=A0A6A6XV78_9PLEO|nr:mitochondrial hypoxia responsive domain-containing protein [Melanomma pulvis-pyrius CBS 109.77]
MKVLTKEEEQRHYNATVRGGTIGGLCGLGIGSAGVIAASRRFHAFRALTVPFRVFLAASTGTFVAVIAADRASAAYDIEHTPQKKQALERDHEREARLKADKTTLQLAKQWAEDNRYPIIFGFWLTSMIGSFAMVNRNPYLTGSQKLVQARMYAQGATLSVLLASFAFETADAKNGKGRWETIKILDPNDPTHKHMIEKRIHHERYAGEDQWREMVEAEEAKINARKAAVKAKQQETESKKPSEEP